MFASSFSADWASADLEGNVLRRCVKAPSLMIPINFPKRDRTRARGPLGHDAWENGTPRGLFWPREFFLNREPILLRIAH
jgi:hypothetical protein